LDESAASKLGRALAKARKKKLGWVAHDAGAFMSRLEIRAQMGKKNGEAFWLLGLELCVYSGDQARFEDKAVEYAATFEISPPLWENLPQAGQGKAAAASGKAAKAAEEALALPEGQLTGKALDEVEAILAKARPGKEFKLDFSRVLRMDFPAAGALVDLLSRCPAKPVILFHPNRIVAELLRAVGVDKVAQVELAKL
jgi:anti-anti-sigma regulatory factor